MSCFPAIQTVSLNNRIVFISRPTDSPDALASYSLLEAIIEPDEVAAIILYP